MVARVEFTATPSLVAFAPPNAEGEGALAAFRRLVRNLRRRAVLAAAVFALFLAAAIGLAFGLPSVYRSSATILIEQQEIPRELVRSTITGFAEQRIREIEQRATISANLGDIMDRYGLYASERELQPLALLVQRMRSDLNVEMISADVVDPQSGRATEATIAFRISFDNQSPELAQRVTNELTTLFLGENLKRRSELATEATQFLASESAKLEAQLERIEGRIGDFKRNNLGRLPEDTATNVQLLAEADTALREAERELTVLEPQSRFLRGQLAGAGSGTLQKRLQDLEAAQAVFAARYAPAHPTVLAAQRELAALRAQLADDPAGNEAADVDMLARQLEARRRDLGPVHPDVRALERALDDARTNTARGTAGDPLSSELRRQLAQAEAQLAAARAARDSASAQIARSSARVSSAPGVEGEYRRLLRDREQTQRKLQDLRDRLMEADVSRALESERKGERFTLIEPAELPQTPIRPNRALLMTAGFVAALLATLAVVALREAFDDSLRDPRDLLLSTGAVALVHLPHANTPEDLRRAARRRRRLTIMAMAATLALLSLLVVLKSGASPRALLALFGL